MNRPFRATFTPWRWMLLALVVAPAMVAWLWADSGTMSLLAADQPAGEPKPTVRCAVIGGMTDTGFWQEVSERFTKETGLAVEVVSTGPKYEIAPAFRRGEADLITMHASDTIINLVADGHGADPQPWARNDLLLVGPKNDPAKIRGLKDSVAALGKIIDSKSKLLVHQSLGTNEVLHDLLAEGEFELDKDNTIVLPSDRHRQLLQKAAREGAYTIVGRIPFLNGKITNDGLELMVQGDPRMRRPYVVVVSSANKLGSPRDQAARRLASFLRSKETQRWIADFGRGKLDDQPLFFPVVIGKNAGEAAAK
jgi:tungstate transport system substrate-binding protein